MVGHYSIKIHLNLNKCDNPLHLLINTSNYHPNSKIPDSNTIGFPSFKHKRFDYNFAFNCVVQTHKISIRMASPSFKQRFQNKVSTMSRFGELELDSNRAISIPANYQIHKTVMQVSASNIIKGNLQSPKAPIHDYLDQPHMPSIDHGSYFTALHASEALPYKHHLSRSVDLAQPINKDILPNLSLQKTIDSHRRNFSYSATQRKVAEEISQVRESPKTRQGSLDSDYYRKIQASPGFKPYTLSDYKAIKPDKYYELGGLGQINVGTEDWVKKKETHDKRKEYAQRIKEKSSMPTYNLISPIKEDRALNVRQMETHIPLSPVKLIDRN